jgi:hypothetical protein
MSSSQGKDNDDIPYLSLSDGTGKRERSKSNSPPKGDGKGKSKSKSPPRKKIDATGAKKGSSSGSKNG